MNITDLNTPVFVISTPEKDENLHSGRMSDDVIETRAHRTAEVHFKNLTEKVSAADTHEVTLDLSRTRSDEIEFYVKKYREKLRELLESFDENLIVYTLYVPRKCALEVVIHPGLH